MRLEELIKSVKERNLSKDQLEDYRDELSILYANLQLEMAELEKQEALFLDQEQNSENKPSVAQSKINWKATTYGQRLIVLKRYCLATKELLNSLKSRLYSIY
jgi:hypothetical protein